MQNITNLPGTWDRYSSFTLVELERRVATGPGTYTSTFYRYVNGPQNITYNGAAGDDRPAVGAVFVAQPFQAPTIVTNAQLGNISQVAFDDHNDIFKTLAMNYDMLDWRVRIWEYGVDASWNPTWIKLKISGRAEDCQWDLTEDDIFTLDVGHDGTPMEVQGPRERYTTNCRFRFKMDPRCGYSGAATSCDRLFPTCVSLGNQVRFGGFPDAPSPGTVIGIWGGTVSYGSRDQYFPTSYSNGG